VVWNVQSRLYRRHTRPLVACPILRRRSLCPVRRLWGGVPTGAAAAAAGAGGRGKDLFRNLPIFSLFSSQIYFSDSLKLQPEDLSPFTTLQRVSYPVDVLPPIEEDFNGWPRQLDSIELLDVQHDAIINTCRLLAAFFPSVRRLCLNSGTNGAHGPIPSEYRSAAELSVSPFLLPSIQQAAGSL